MIRTQIQLDGKRCRRLREVARELNVSMGKRVREGTDLAISQYERRRKWEAARALVGRFKSGRSDVAGAHDHHLAGIFTK